MKITNSIKNSIFAMISNILAILIGLISQFFFLKFLSIEYLGLNGLFSNIISMLGIMELGIGNAIVYNLYAPLVEKNYSKVNSLMNFYKKCYRLIGITIFILGLGLIPFLPLIIKNISINININLVYFLFLLEVSISYFFSYKRSLLYADQKNYYVNIIHIFYLLFMNIFLIIFLFLTRNYYFYLIIKIIFRMTENLLIHYIVNKKYKHIDFLIEKDLDSDTKKDIFQKVKALFFHKIGSFVVNGTDNIIISKFIGITAVGLYSNYFLIINSVQTLFCQTISGVTASVGHLLVEKNEEKSFYIFDKIRFINFWIATFSSISILLIIQPFITLWIGKEYLISSYVVIVLSINYFFRMMTMCFSVFKESAGIFKEDQFIPLLESAINIIFSIFLSQRLGLAGVFLGTFISSLTYWMYSYPRFIYKGLFKKNYREYLIDNGKYFFLFFIILIISSIISYVLATQNIIINLIINILISIFIPNIIIIIIFYKNNKLLFFYDIFKKTFIKRW